MNHVFTVHKQHLFPYDRCCIAIAVFLKKFISSLYCLPFTSYKFITYEIARLGSTFTAVVILRRKKFISRIFSQHRLLGEKGKDIWIYEDKKMQRTLKNSLKNRGFIPVEACEAGRRDWTVFGVVDETTTTKFASRACAVHCISLPVVVDKVVLVVLKFPIDRLPAV